MSHTLVDQLRFTRSELERALDGVSADDAVIRFEPMNCISWMVGHLAWQENRLWCIYPRGRNIAPQLEPLVAFGKPASRPPLDDMWEAWRKVTKAADEELDSFTAEGLGDYYQVDGIAVSESIGTLLHRNIYHYWFHIGEALAVRQLVGHKDLPEFVGSFPDWALYRKR